VQLRIKRDHRDGVFSSHPPTEMEGEGVEDPVHPSRFECMFSQSRYPPFQMIEAIGSIKGVPSGYP